MELLIKKTDLLDTPCDRYNDLPVLSAVKIGRKEYPIKKGDYILYNGACYQFCSGDGRTLKLERYTQYTNLRLPDAMVKKIPFNDMQKQNYKSSGMDLVRWFF